MSYLYPPAGTTLLMTELEKTLAEPAEREAFRTACGTFIKHVPDAYWTENYGDGYDGVSPTIPLYEVFDDCGRTIYDFFLNILYDPDVKEQGLFADFRRQLFKNECRKKTCKERTVTQLGSVDLL